MKKKTERPTIRDEFSPKTNKYGFRPCPRCGGQSRSVKQDDPDFVLCSDCRFQETFLLIDSACEACLSAEHKLQSKDGDKLCYACSKKPKCDGCRKRKVKVISTPGGSYCGPCAKRRGI